MTTGWRCDTQMTPDIRDTLGHTRTATYSVVMQYGGPDRVPVGTGFFVSPDGLFATAAHVLRGGRPIQIVSTSEPLSLWVVDQAPLHVDAAADFALLQIDMERANGQVPCLTLSERLLDEGEPVYAHGYPLTQVRQPVGIPLGPPGDDLTDSEGNPLKNPVGFMMNHGLSPRTTSAIVASAVEFQWLFEPTASEQPDVYVLDKALNYGNSGGPIIATDTGHAHAFCARFQPVRVPQSTDPDGSAVVIPSLYGVAVRLTHAPVRQALDAQGVTFVDT